MAKTGETQAKTRQVKGGAGKGLAGIEKVVKRAATRGPAPVHLWNPDYCGELDIRIAGDGTWFYLGTPIGRMPLVKLFATVLRHDDDDRYYLVTPVEKIGITVDDAPFVAVAMEVAGEGREQVISFRTNVGDEVTVDNDHPLRFETEEGSGGLKPYVLVRGRLEALVVRAVYYDLVALAMHEEIDGEERFGVWSNGRFFAMALSSTVAEQQ
jgi:hypothetical protein